jgi:hypothetical protein
METRPWRHAAGPAVILFVVLQGIGGAYTIVNFESSSPTVVAKMSGPGNVFSVNISVPAQCHILRAGMNLTPVGPEPAHPSFPEGGRVLLNDTTIWEFNATGAGQLGRQDEFVNGASGWASMFGPAGGANTSAIRIPRTASVGNASMEAWCGGPGGFYDIVNFTGVSYDWMGFSVAGAGDVNGDGYDDVLLGAPGVDWQGELLDAGAAYLFFGPLEPGVHGASEAAYLFQGTTSASAASDGLEGGGDIDGDGYSDILISAVGPLTASPFTAGDVFLFYGGPQLEQLAD